MTDLDIFITNIHSSSMVISKGLATLGDRTVEAVEVRNLYGQQVIWGPFSVDNRKGKFVGKLANNANTEGVSYVRS